MEYAVVVLVAWFLYDRFLGKEPLQINFPIVHHLLIFLPWLSQFFRIHVLDRPGEAKDKPYSQNEMDYVKKAAVGDNPLMHFGAEVVEKPLYRFLTSRFPFAADPTRTYHPSPIVIGLKSEQPYFCASRIWISALSFGALSGPAVEAISAGAKHYGTLYNVGEGGIPEHTERGGGDLIFQIGTAKYYIAPNAFEESEAQYLKIKHHPQIKLVEIKLSQGASIGKEGGFLPGVFMTENYAHARQRRVGQDTVAPNTHPEFSADDELGRYISKIRVKTGKPTGVKLGLSHEGQWDPFFEFLSNEVKNGREGCVPDFITIDGAEGGTSGGKVAFLQYIGLPLHEALSSLVASLEKYGLRKRVIIVASGKLATPERAAMAFCLGADVVAIGRGVMFSLGCIQAMRCLKRTCPTGITTHNAYLEKGIIPLEKSKRVASYLERLHRDINAVAHACGVESYNQLTTEHIVMTQDRRGRYVQPIPIRSVK